MARLLVVVGLISLSAVAMTLQAQTEGLLDSAQLSALISGNTTHSEDLGTGKKYMAFHDANGSWVLKREDGAVFFGTWTLERDGSYCAIIQNIAGKCARIRKNPDGTYTRIVDGVPRFKWTKVTAGRGF